MSLLSEQTIELSKKFEKLRTDIGNLKLDKTNKTYVKELGDYVENFGRAVLDAYEHLVRKCTSMLLDMQKSTEARNSALDSTINARAISEVQKVCDLAKTQQLQVKLSNVQLDGKPLTGSPDSKSKLVLEKIPLGGDDPGNISFSTIRTIGKPREGSSLVLVECKDQASKQALFKRCKNGNVRASHFYPKYLHSFSTKLNEAYRNTPSLKDQWIRTRFNFERRTIIVQKKAPEGSDWDLVETMRIPIPKSYVTREVKQIASSKILTETELENTIPSTIDL